MVNEEKYLLVAESIAPEIFKKVLEAKKYIATGKAANSSEAVRLANISRSAFYKYKDRVMEYNSRESNAIVTFYMTMEDVRQHSDHQSEHPLGRGGRRHHIDPHDRCDAGGGAAAPAPVPAARRSARQPRRLSLHPIHGRLSLHPIHVLVGCGN